MKNKMSMWVLSTAALLMFSSGLLAQEKTEVTIRIKKDGELVKDTTYQFESASEAENAVKMMEIISEDESIAGEHQYNYSMSTTEGNQNRTMVFISEGGEHARITELEGDSLVWIKEGDDSDFQGEHVIVMKGKDGGIVNIVMEDDDEGDGDGTNVIIIKKQVEKDHDVDLDKDVDVDVDVKVIRKKKTEEGSL